MRCSTIFAKYLGSGVHVKIVIPHREIKESGHKRIFSCLKFNLNRDLIKSELSVAKQSE